MSLAAGFLFLLYAIAQAQINPEINYQAKLTDLDDKAVPDGSYNIRFRLYAQPTGGSPLWTETWCHSPDGGATCDGTGTDNRVDVVSGLLSVLLGSTTPLTSVDFNQTLWLGVEIGGAGATPDWDGEMAPRKRLGTVPAAFEAQRLVGLPASAFLRSDTDTSFTSGTLTFDAGTALIVNGAATLTSATSTDFHTTTFGIGGDTFTSLVGSGLANDFGALTVSGLSTSNFSSANVSQWTNDAGYLISSNNLSELTSTSTARTNLGVAIGTDVQAFSANLEAIAGLSSSADTFPYFTGSGTAALTTLTSFARSLLDDPNAAAARTTLGLGTIATQDGDNVAITGGTIEGTTIGATTPSTAVFTNATSSNLFATALMAANATTTSSFSTAALSVSGTATSTFSAGIHIPSLQLGSDLITSLTGTGLTKASGALTVTLAPFSTSDLAEGADLYWTNARFDERLSATTTLPNLTTLANLTTIGTIAAGTWQGSVIQDAFIASDITLDNLTQITNRSILDTTGTLSVARGGTGITSIGQGQFLYGSAANTIAATSAIFLAQSGNVGIGTAVPLAKLDVRPIAHASNQSGGIRLDTTTSNWPSGVFLRSDATAVPRLSLIINNTELLSLRGNSNVGIGVLNPQKKLDIDGDIRVRGDLATINFFRTTSPTDIAYLQHDNSNNRFDIAANNKVIRFLNISGFAESMRIGSTGNVGIGTTNPDTSKLHVVGLATGAGDRSICATNTGGVIRINSGACGTSSIVFKENIRPLRYGLNDVILLNPVVFNYTNGAGEGRMDDFVGLIAEEVFEVIPEVVQYNDDGTPYSIDYPNLTALNIKAIQDLDTKVNTIARSTATSTHLFIDSAGRLGVGTSTPTAQLHTTGTVRFSNFGAGTLETDASGIVSVSSDKALKEAIEPFARSLEDLMQIDPITFRWKDDSGMDTSRAYTGFTAQNVQNAIPEAIGTSSDGTLTLSTRPILATIVNAIKDLATTVSGFAERFVTRQLSFERAEGDHLAVRQLEADDLTADRAQVSELCIDDICVTRDGLAALLASQAQNTSGSSTQTVTSSTSASQTRITTSESASDDGQVATSTATTSPSSSSDDDHAATGSPTAATASDTAPPSEPSPEPSSLDDQAAPDNDSSASDQSATSTPAANDNAPAPSESSTAATSTAVQ